METVLPRSLDVCQPACPPFEGGPYEARTMPGSGSSPALRRGGMADDVSPGDIEEEVQIEIHCAPSSSFSCAPIGSPSRPYSTRSQNPRNISTPQRMSPGPSRAEPWRIAPSGSEQQGRQLAAPCSTAQETARKQARARAASANSSPCRVSPPLLSSGDDVYHGATTSDGAPLAYRLSPPSRQDSLPDDEESLFDMILARRQQLAQESQQHHQQQQRQQPQQGSMNGGPSTLLGGCPGAATMQHQQHHHQQQQQRQNHQQQECTPQGQGRSGTHHVASTGVPGGGWAQVAPRLQHRGSSGSPQGAQVGASLSFSSEALPLAADAGEGPQGPGSGDSPKDGSPPVRIRRQVSAADALLRCAPEGRPGSPLLAPAGQAHSELLRRRMKGSNLSPLKVALRPSPGSGAGAKGQGQGQAVTSVKASAASGPLPLRPDGALSVALGTSRCQVLGDGSRQGSPVVRPGTALAGQPRMSPSAGGRSAPGRAAHHPAAECRDTDRSVLAVYQGTESADVGCGSAGTASAHLRQSPAASRRKGDANGLPLVHQDLEGPARPGTGERGMRPSPSGSPSWRHANGRPREPMAGQGYAPNRADGPGLGTRSSIGEVATVRPGTAVASWRQSPASSPSGRHGQGVMVQWEGTAQRPGTAMAGFQQSPMGSPTARHGPQGMMMGGADAAPLRPGTAVAAFQQSPMSSPGSRHGRGVMVQGEGVDASQRPGTAAAGFQQSPGNSPGVRGPSQGSVPAHHDVTSGCEGVGSAAFKPGVGTKGIHLRQSPAGSPRGKPGRPPVYREGSGESLPTQGGGRPGTAVKGAARLSPRHRSLETFDGGQVQVGGEGLQEDPRRFQEASSMGSGQWGSTPGTALKDPNLSFPRSNSGRASGEGYEETSRLRPVPGHHGVSQGHYEGSLAAGSPLYNSAELGSSHLSPRRSSMGGEESQEASRMLSASRSLCSSAGGSFQEEPAGGLPLAGTEAQLNDCSRQMRHQRASPQMMSPDVMAPALRSPLDRASGQEPRQEGREQLAVRLTGGEGPLEADAHEDVGDVLCFIDASEPPLGALQHMDLHSSSSRSSSSRSMRSASPFPKCSSFTAQESPQGPLSPLPSSERAKGAPAFPRASTFQHPHPHPHPHPPPPSAGAGTGASLEHPLSASAGPGTGAAPFSASGHASASTSGQAPVARQGSSMPGAGSAALPPSPYATQGPLSRLAPPGLPKSPSSSSSPSPNAFPKRSPLGSPSPLSAAQHATQGPSLWHTGGVRPQGQGQSPTGRGGHHRHHMPDVGLEGEPGYAEGELPVACCGAHQVFPRSAVSSPGLPSSPKSVVSDGFSERGVMPAGMDRVNASWRGDNEGVAQGGHGTVARARSGALPSPGQGQGLTGPPTRLHGARSRDRERDKDRERSSCASSPREGQSPYTTSPRETAAVGLTLLKKWQELQQSVEASSYNGRRGHKGLSPGDSPGGGQPLPPQHKKLSSADSLPSPSASPHILDDPVVRPPSRQGSAIPSVGPTVLGAGAGARAMVLGRPGAAKAMGGTASRVQRSMGSERDALRSLQPRAGPGGGGQLRHGPCASVGGSSVEEGEAGYHIRPGQDLAQLLQAPGGDARHPANHDVPGGQPGPRIKHSAMHSEDMDNDRRGAVAAHGRGHGRLLGTGSHMEGGRGGSGGPLPPKGLKLNDFVLGKPYEDIKNYFALHRKEIGSGQFGVIRKCKEISTGYIYACKTIDKKCIQCDEDAEDIRREVGCLMMLRQHPTVVTLRRALEDAECIHIVMDLMKGGDLLDRVTAKGHLSEGDCARVCRSLVEALLHCHCLGIMHRDIKPENILLKDRDSDCDIKLVDFGVATFFEPNKPLTDCIGTPEYMAPEVLRMSYGPKADIWSAGVVVYIAMSGIPPFWASSRHTLAQSILEKEVSFRSTKWTNVSAECKDLVTRMLTKDPDKRISATEILNHPWILQHASA